MNTTSKLVDIISRRIGRTSPGPPPRGGGGLENPDIGRKREEIKKGHLSFLAGSHVIFYRESKNHVDIIDILHQSMEPYRHLEG